MKFRSEKDGIFIYIETDYFYILEKYTHQTKLKMASNSTHDILSLLKARFEENMNRHQNIKWKDVASKLETNSQKLASLQQMEDTGGEPDVVGKDTKTGEFIFMDCSPESPKGRRSLCYDQKALDQRKENKPKDNAESLAKKMKIEILSEEQYRFLQTLDKFDAKTSSWLKTPDPIRNLGGAIFGDCRYEHVFIYHNGAESYYAARGFRGVLKV